MVQDLLVVLVQEDILVERVILVISYVIMDYQELV